MLETRCQNLKTGISLTTVDWNMQRIGRVQKIKGAGSGTHGKPPNRIMQFGAGKEASRIQEPSGNWSAM